jgi:hypothetical protein
MAREIDVERLVKEDPEWKELYEQVQGMVSGLTSGMTIDDWARVLSANESKD